MKRVAIITYHRAHNYGAVLQAYALKKVISNLGYNVSFIDYQSDVLTGGYNLIPPANEIFHPKTFIKSLKKILHFILDFRRKYTRAKNFKEFIKKHFVLDSIEEVRNYHALVLGSDQIWNSSYTKGVDNAYYGIINNINSKLKVSYAASMGSSKLLKTEEDLFLNNINGLDRIGVREKQLRDYIFEISGLETEVNLDPTLLLNKQEWDTLSISESINFKPYILVYEMHTHSNTTDIVDNLREKFDLEVVVLSSQTDFKTPSDHITSESPEYFLGLFKNATFVVTSSFHGTVFSIINNVDFFTMKFNSDIDIRSAGLL